MIQVLHVSKIYRQKNNADVRALEDINLDFDNKGLVFIIGKSGSGKSTLLNILGGLDNYEGGEIFVDGISTRNYSAADFDRYRNEQVGMVFQDFFLLEEMTVEKNIALAIELQGKKATPKIIADALASVDLSGYGKRKPSQLSGGQKQRVAIARAFVKEPKIILADEPTGNLDSATGEQIFSLLKQLSENKLILVVSHDKEAASRYGDRIIELADGKIVADGGVQDEKK